MNHAIKGEDTSRTEIFNKTENRTSRLFYMDNLRALAMLVGILFHAALAYSPLMHNLWFTSSHDSSWAFDLFAFFTHLFRMPVFFLISGFFALMLIEKRGISGLLKNRLIRIALPFIVFFPLLLIAYMAVLGWAVEEVKNLSPMMQFIKMMAANPNAPKPPLTTMHLWFLYNLMMFVLVVAALYKTKFFDSTLIKKLCSKPVCLLVFPLLLVPAFANQFAPHPAPEKFYPELWSFGLYGMFFLFGAVIYTQQSVLQLFDKYKHRLLFVALVAYGYFYYSLPATISPEQTMKMMAGFQFDLAHLPIAIAEAYVAAYMSFYLIAAAKTSLNKSSKLMRLIADSSYWIYIIHMPVLLMIQFTLADIELNLWIKFVISCSGTFLIGLLSYLVLVRWTPIGWMLNGRKETEKPKNFVLTH